MSSTFKCHCCLAQGCNKDIFTEYFCNGQKEVYSEMLQNTLNIIIPHTNKTINDKICDQCIIDLRSATEFKNRILSSRSHQGKRKTKLDLQLNNLDYKIAVDFHEDLRNEDLGDNKQGKIFYIELTQQNAPCNNSSRTSPEQHFNDEAVKRTEEESLKHSSSLGLYNEDADKMKIKRKLKQPESQNHKNMKQNSIKLVFNSNLCLFKSLKTKFGCFLCDEAFFTIKELRQHSKLHSDELIRSKFNRLRGLSYHNADISSLECTKCAQACFDLNDLKKHLMSGHDVEFGEAEHFIIPYKLEDSFDCVVCSEKFNTYMRLSVHMNNHFSYNVCEICGNSYINRMSLRIHQSRHRENKCRLCSETFLSNYARVRHMRSCHNSSFSKRYCLICGKTFRYTYQLVDHRVQEHGLKRQLSKCTLCSKTFPNAQNLKIHVRSVHVRERNFPCNECDMRFFTKFDQKRHEKTHIDVRSFACGYCESRFKGKDSLRRHLKRQHGHVPTELKV